MKNEKHVRTKSSEHKDLSLTQYILLETNQKQYPN